MELRHLRYFIAVASHGSFSRAAEALHLTQPPLSRQIRDLEEELGVPLLVRGTNMIRLTEAGELFYEEAREVLARADEAVRRVRGQMRREILRVGYAPSLIADIISAVLIRFKRAAPRVRIELADLSSREINDQAAAGQLDLIVSPAISVTKGITGFQLTELRRVEVVLALPAKHPLARLKRIPVTRLNHLPLVGLAKENYPEYVPSMRAIMKPCGVSLRFVSLVNDGISTLFTELEAQQAGALLAESVVDIIPRTLVIRPFSPKPPVSPVMIGIPALRPSPHAETLARILLEEARAR